MNNAPRIPELLSVEQLAVKFHLPNSAPICALIHDGRLVPTANVGRYHLFEPGRVEEVRAALRENPAISAAEKCPQLLSGRTIAIALKVRPCVVYNEIKKGALLPDFVLMPEHHRPLYLFWPDRILETGRAIAARVVKRQQPLQIFYKNLIRLSSNEVLQS